MVAINSSIMRTVNRKIILNQIRRQPISRAELSERTHLTRASITQIVDGLMREGLVEETAVIGRNQLGRRLTQLDLVKDARYFIGIGFSCIKYTLSIVNLRGEALYQFTDKLPDSDPDDVVNQISILLKRTVYQLKLTEEKILGIGIHAPGPLDIRNGIMLSSSRLPRWHNYPVVARFEQALGFKTSLCSVSNARALDELYFGVGCQNIHNFLLLDIGHCVGAGIILNDMLYTGAYGRAPEIGHISVDPAGPLCACGNRGCLENYISLPKALENTSFNSWKQVIDSLDTNPEAERILEYAAEKLSHGLINLINVFDLEKYILSGDLAYGGDILASRINRLIQRRCLCGPEDNPVIGGNPIDPARTAAISAYHSFFAEA